MAERRWDDDDSLLADLAEAIADLEGHEQAVAALGRGAFAWRTVDDDLLLASLSYDSFREPAANLRSAQDPHDAQHPPDAREDGDPGAGSGTGPRTLIFNSSPLTIELEVLDGRVIGQLVPPSVGTVVIEATGAQPLRVQADELGFFVVDSAPTGPIRIRCETEAARLVTDWIQL